MPRKTPPSRKTNRSKKPSPKGNSKGKVPPFDSYVEPRFFPTAAKLPTAQRSEHQEVLDEMAERFFSRKSADDDTARRLKSIEARLAELSRGTDARLCRLEEFAQARTYAEATNPPEIDEGMKYAQSILDDIVKDLRRLGYAIYSPVMDRNEFRPALVKLEITNE